jgi:hypothetical protein
MHAYDVAGWQDFFVGTIGASAGLLGLLFVTISINLQEILKYRHLPGRAASTLGILLAALLVSGLGLAPGQSSVVLGVEVLLISGAVVVQALWVTRGKRDPAEPIVWSIEHRVIGSLPGSVLAVGAISLLVASGGGLYWLMAGILLAFVVASINAWVLLVEILR